MSADLVGCRNLCRQGPLARPENKMTLIECVPNFSEGRDAAVVERIRSAIASVPAVALLDQTLDPDHNRSVFTFVGEPDPVVEAVSQAARVAVEQIDLRQHTGVHPRIGALDVVPLVPLEGASSEICIALAHRLGQDLWNRLRLPVYFYGDAALDERRRRLEQIRRGGFEALAASLPEDADRRPDVGGPDLHPPPGLLPSVFASFSSPITSIWHRRTSRSPNVSLRKFESPRAGCRRSRLWGLNCAAAI